MFCVYIIQHTNTKEKYIGYTKNLQKRLDEHNNKSTPSTKRKSGKWIVIYAEAYRSETDAQEREKKLKQHGSSKHELFKRIQQSFLKDGS